MHLKYRVTGAAGFIDMQPGGVKHTLADTSRLEAVVGDKPQAQIKDRIRCFVAGYRACRAGQPRRKAGAEDR